MNLLLIFIMLLTIGACILFSFLRKLAKARIRGICAIVCAILAILTTVLMRKSLVSGDMVNETLIPLLEEANIEQLIELLHISDTLNDALINCVASLIMPVLCLVFFLLYSFLTWVIYLIVTLVFSQQLKDHNDRCSHQLPRALIWGAVQGLVVVFVWMIPLASYAEIVDGAMSGILEAGTWTEQEQAELNDIKEETIVPLNGGVVKVYRALGGNAVCGWLTDFEVNGQKVHMADEVGAIASFGGNIGKLGQVKMENYGHTEAQVFTSMADSFDRSVLLPTIAGEVIHDATGKWQAGGTFLGAQKPSFGEMTEVVDPFFNTLLSVLYQDSSSANTNALRADIHTVGDMVGILADHGVFGSLSNTNDLMNALSSDGIVNKLVNTLGSNNSMKVLIPEITNMGMRAIAVTLNIPGDAAEVYADFMDDVVYALNDVRALEGDAQVDALTAHLNTAFDEAGIEIDPELIDCYSVSMITDLVNTTDVTTVEDVEDFFALIADIQEDAQSEGGDATEGVALIGSIGLGNGNGREVKGNAYAGKSKEELERSGAAALRKAYRELQKNGSVGTEATEILVAVYAEVLSEDADKLNKIANIQLTVAVSEKSVEVTASLATAETLITQKVTLDQLLIDSATAAESINTESLLKEAAAVESIFQAASSLQQQGEHMNLDNMAASVGTVLNNLNNTATFGSEKTSNLLVAVFQSETVRETANIDMKTATQMANAATDSSKGEVDYSKTMTAVSQGVNVFNKLGKEGGTVAEEDLVVLIQNINPQTAGMIEVYATAERIESYNVPAKYAGTSSELIRNTFHYMANEQLENYDAEAKALNQILNIALSAKSHSGEKNLYTTDTEQGILPGNATSTVEDFMNSHAISYGLRATMLDENNNIKNDKKDAFGLGGKMNQEAGDYQATVDAINAYYASHATEENKLTLTALAALLGVDMQDLHFAV